MGEVLKNKYINMKLFGTNSSQNGGLSRKVAQWRQKIVLLLMKRATNCRAYRTYNAK